MKRIILCLVVSVSLSAPAMADVYKCTINGKTAFSDQPCSNAAQKINVRPASGNPDQATAEQAVAASKEFVQKQKNDSTRRELNDSIDRAKDKIDKLTKERDARIAELRYKKSRANNNLAGAVWEQSLSNEMIAVTNEYEAKLKVANQELADLQTKLAAPMPSPGAG